MFRWMGEIDHLRRVRFWLAIFMAALVLSGLTAFPLQSEIRLLDATLRTSSLRAIAISSGSLGWIDQVYEGLTRMNGQYPFLAYGTDWLAFAHIVIAAAFIGPYIDPVRNKWVVTFGLIACVGVIPLALIAGPIRGIPLGWRLIDCSFGVVGSIPLILCRRHILALEQKTCSSLTSLA